MMGEQSSLSRFAIGMMLLVSVTAGVYFALPVLATTFTAEVGYAQVAQVTPLIPKQEEQPQAEPQQPDQGYVSEDALQDILKENNRSHEAMADKIVIVAASGDASQTAIAYWPVCFLGIIVFGFLLLVALAGRKGREEANDRVRY